MRAERAEESGGGGRAPSLVPSPYDVARDCLAASKGDRAGAVSRFIGRLRQDKALLTVLMWPLLEIAIRSAVVSVGLDSRHMSARISGLSLTAGGERAIVARAGATSPKMTADEERTAARSIVMRDWYAARLYGGRVRLGDATRAELETSAARRVAQADGFMRGARLEKAIAARLSNPKQKVREALTPVQIHEIARGLR